MVAKVIYNQLTEVVLKACFAKHLLFFIEPIQALLLSGENRYLIPVTAD